MEISNVKEGSKKVNEVCEIRKASKGNESCKIAKDSTKVNETCEIREGFKFKDTVKEDSIVIVDTETESGAIVIERQAEGCSSTHLEETKSNIQTSCWSY